MQRFNQLQGFFSVIGFPHDLETFLFPVHQIFYSLSEQKFIFHNQNFNHTHRPPQQCTPQMYPSCILSQAAAGKADRKASRPSRTRAMVRS